MPGVANLYFCPMWIAIAVLFIFVATFFGIGWWLSSTPFAGPTSDHFDGYQFLNQGNARAQNLSSVVKWIYQRQQGPWEDLTVHPVSVVKPPKKSNPITAIYYINHSSFLIQLDGKNILTDPVFSKRVSPFSFAGPRRMQNPGIAFENLPHIDLILLSHNHYDHLDLLTVRRLQTKHDPLFLVPLGVKDFLLRKGISKILELDWWNTEHFQDLSITCTQAQHFSGRGLFDRDRSLWCGYSIQGREHQVLFIGDTGFGKFFLDFPDRIGQPDVAIIPIGAYKPEWFMHPIHCSPAQAIDIHTLIKSKRSIACHFGTFPLGDDGMKEPPSILRRNLQEKGIPLDSFVILEHGQHLQI